MPQGQALGEAGVNIRDSMFTGVSATAYGSFVSTAKYLTGPAWVSDHRDSGALHTDEEESPASV